MAIECNVIRDLLPLYCDQALSVESEALVAEHLKTCAACAGVAARMQEKIEVPPVEEMSLADAWKGFRRALKRTRLRAIALGILIALALVWAGSWGWEALTREPHVQIPAENIEISDLSKTSLGELLFHMKAKDGTEWLGYNILSPEDGIVYCTARRALIPLRDRWDPDNWIEPEIRLRGGIGYLYDDFDHAEIMEVSQLRYGTPKEYITIWETGMDVPFVDEATNRWYLENDNVRPG